MAILYERCDLLLLFRDYYRHAAAASDLRAAMPRRSRDGTGRELKQPRAAVAIYIRQGSRTPYHEPASRSPRCKSALRHYGESRARDE